MRSLALLLLLSGCEELQVTDVEDGRGDVCVTDFNRRREIGSKMSCWDSNEKVYKDDRADSFGTVYRFPIRDDRSCMVDPTVDIIGADVLVCLNYDCDHGAAEVECDAPAYWNGYWACCRQCAAEGCSLSLGGFYCDGGGGDESGKAVVEVKATAPTACASYTLTFHP